MTSKLVVNTIESDTGISSVSFASSISMNSTAKFHFSAAGIDIGADTNINRPAAGVLGFNVNGAEKVRIDSSGHMHGVGVVTATHFYGDGSNLTGLPAGTTINSNTNNYLITGTGTANTLQGESQLTYDGVSFKNLFSATGYTPITAEFRNTASVWGGGVRFKSSNTYGSIEIMRYNGNYGAGLYNSTGGWHWDGNLQFHGSVTPWTDGNLNLGSSSKRWANLYINDLQLSNKGSTNSVDNTWGDYTIQEGESDLFLINNRNGKKYKFNLTEVS